MTKRGSNHGSQGVVLVDDGKEFVETRGFKVRTAVGGNEALARFREWESDVVIFDVLMPGLITKSFLW